jgi:hypothetical protein
VSGALTTALLLVMATIVAYMRWRVAPIQPRRVAFESRSVRNT